MFLFEVQKCDLVSQLHREGRITETCPDWETASRRKGQYPNPWVILILL